MARSDGSLLQALNSAGVEFVVVGGLAVNLAGYPRFTKDVDVIVGASVEAFAPVRVALEGLGATQLDGTLLDEALFDGEHVLTTKSEHGRLDILPEGESPLTVAEMLERGTRVEHDGVAIVVCSVRDLALLKRLADRSQDRADLEALEDLYGSLE